MREDSTRNEIASSQSNGLQGEVSSATRRAMLLKGLSRGIAGVAAAAPLRSFADARPSLTVDGRICSISGMQSGAHSQKPNFEPCSGHSPGYWKNHCSWPGGYSSGLLVVAPLTTRGVKVEEPKTTGKPDEKPQEKTPPDNHCSQGNTGTTFASAFGVTESTFPSTIGGPGHISWDDAQQTMMWILWNRSESDEAHWICALLNAAQGTFDGGIFPYETQDVVGFYNGTPTEYLAAYTLFTDLENGVAGDNL